MPCDSADIKPIGLNQCKFVAGDPLTLEELEALKMRLWSQMKGVLETRQLPLIPNPYAQGSKRRYKPLYVRLRFFGRCLELRFRVVPWMRLKCVIDED